MNTDNNKSDLYIIVADTFEVDVKTVDDNTSSEDIKKWDSLGQLQLLAAIESFYSINFEISEIFQIFNLGDIRKILIKKGLSSWI